jgi:hypothetical protein
VKSGKIARKLIKNIVMNSISTIPDKLIKPKVLSDFEKVRIKLCEELKVPEVKEQIRNLFNEIPNIEDGVILDVLYEVCELLTPETLMSVDSQLFFSQKQL